MRLSSKGFGVFLSPLSSSDEGLKDFPNFPVMKCTPLLLCLLSLLVSLSLTDQSAAQISVTKIGEYPVSTDGMPRNVQTLNLISHQDDAIVSFNGYQYCVYYTVNGSDTRNRFVTIGRRALPDGAWDELQLTDYRQVTNDSHNVIAMGIDEGDGTIHLAFDHHNSSPRITINYRISVEGLATNPSAHEWVASKFRNVRDSLPGLSSGQTRGTTYPRFLNRPDGSLQFSRRQGSAVAGQLILYSYDDSDGEWTRNGVYVNGTTEDHDIPRPTPPFYRNSGGELTKLNGYLNGLTYDDTGRMHASWIWRSTGGRNFDFMYAYSDNFGRDWKNNDGQDAARINRTPMLYENEPPVRVFEIPDTEGLANQTGQAIDRLGRVHVVQRQRGRFLHLWRDTNGEWRQTRFGDIVGGRNKITVDQNNNVYLMTRSAVIYAATPASDFTDWAVVYDGDRGRFAGDPQFDENRMKREGILSIFVGEGGSSRNLYSIDLSVSPINQDPAMTFGNGGTPGTGEPWVIASGADARTQLEAENFDQGPSGVAYGDSTPENRGSSDYRPDTEVDLAGNTNIVVGFVTAGEFLQYSLDVEAVGFYDLTFRYAKGSDGVSQMRALSNRTDLAGEIDFPNTGTFGNLQEVTQRVLLQAGPQTLRLEFVNGSMNLDSFSFTSVRPEEITMVNLQGLAESSDPTTWSDGLAAHTGADYIVPNQGQLRSETNSSTFPGFSLRVEPGGRYQFRALESNQETTTVDRLILEGGTTANLGTPAGLQAGTGSNTTNVLSGNIETSGYVRFLTFDRANGNPLNREMRVASQISGSGRIELWEGQGNQGGDTVTITNPENTFTGLWEIAAGSDLVFENEGAVGSASILVRDGSLQIEGNWNSGSSLTFTDSPDVSVDLGGSSWTVDTLVFGTSFVPDGVYRAAQINALLTNQVFTGSGTITVGSVAPGGPLAHWKFDEGRGTTANDATGAGNIGTLFHGPQWASDETRASYLSFDGNDDRVSTLFTYALSESDDFTWSWWANQQSASDADRNALMVGNRYGGTGSEALEFIKFTTTRGEFLNGSNLRYDYEDIVPGDWHHYTMVKTGNSYQWYLDGQPEGSPVTLAYSENDPLPFNIGGDDNDSTAGGQGNEHFEGFIDEVVLYDRALSAEEVALVMTTTNEAVQTSPIESWRLTHFDDEVDQGEAANISDPNEDGESNLLEFATGQDPYADTRLATPVAVTEGGIVQFTYTRSHQAVSEGISFQVVWSETLEEASWGSAGVTEAVLSDDGLTETVVASMSNSSVGKLFMRLNIGL